MGWLPLRCENCPDDTQVQRVRDDSGTLRFLCGLWSRPLTAILPVLSRGLNYEMEGVLVVCPLATMRLFCSVIPIKPELEPLVKAACENMSLHEAKWRLSRELAV